MVLDSILSFKGKIREFPLIGILGAFCGVITILTPLECSIWLIVVIGFCIICKVALITQQHRNPPTFLVNVFALAFFIRVIGVIGLYYGLSAIHNSPFLLGATGSDDSTYHHWAWQIAQAWREGGSYCIPSILRGYTGYIYFNALLYYFIGPSTIAARIMNALFGAFVVVYVYRIGRHTFDEKLAKIASILTAFFPNLVLFSALQYKDTLLALLCVLGLWQVIKMSEQTNLLQLIMLAFCIGLISTLRWQVAMGLMLITILNFLLNWCSLSSKGRLVFIINVMFLVSLIYMLQPGMLRRDIFQISRFGEFMQTRLDQFRLTHQNPIVRDLLSKVYLMPLYVMFPLIMPIPSLLYGKYPLVDKLITPGVIVWHMLLPFFFYGMFLAIRTLPRKTFPLYSFVIGSVIGLFIMFFLEAIRQTIMIMPINTIFIAIGLRNYKKCRRWFHIYIPFMLLIYIVYNVLRASFFDIA